MERAQWFTKTTVDEHEIQLPGMGEELDLVGAEMAAQDADTGTIDQALAKIREDMTAKIKLRPLTAGDVSKISELRLGIGGATIALGEAKLLAVELALVEWELPMTITRDTIAALNPQVFEQIYELVDVGEGTVGAGAPPTPPAQPAAERQPEAAAPIS